MNEKWPATARHLFEVIQKAYGDPDEVTTNFVVWYHNEPWKRTTLHREGILHNFPVPHEDVLEQTVDYRVPKEKVEELARFDGSILIDRTAGELSARCQNEQMNMVLLNLAHQIVVNEMTPETARETFAGMMSGFKFNWSTPLAKKLYLPLGRLVDRENDTCDPDSQMH